VSAADFEPLILRWRPEDDTQRFGIWHFPRHRAPIALTVHVHALTEEMNKSRRMVALQARRLAEAGHAVLLFDLLGCGDSGGEMADATWETWLDDVRQATHWAHQRWRQQWPGYAVAQRWLWGHRCGSLLALAAGRQLPERWDCVFWQATPNGKTLLQQLLRLDTVGALMAKGQGKGDAKVGARQRLAAGQVAQVAGYGIHPGLASGLEAARLTPLPQARRLVWIDVAAQADAAPSPAVDAVLKQWTEAGCAVHHQTVQGPSFWQTTEIEDAPALLDATTRALDGATAKLPQSGAAQGAA
jgi:uncharacterized protein